jgi:hypothetical protein
MIVWRTRPLSISVLATGASEAHGWAGVPENNMEVVVHVLAILFYGAGFVYYVRQIRKG